MSRDHVITRREETSSGKCIVSKEELPKTNFDRNKNKRANVYRCHFVVKADYVQSAANSENSLLSAIDSA